MRKSKYILAFALAALLALQGCMRPEINDTPVETEEEKVIVGHYKTVKYNYSTGINESVLTTKMNEKYLLLMNKTHSLDESYAPENRTALTCPTLNDKMVELETGTSEALLQMFREMRAAGVTDVMVASGYRSYSYQRMLFNMYLQEEQETISADAYICLGSDYILENYINEGKTKLNYSDALRVVQSYAAEPGKSEHQTGLCVDFITSTMDSLTVAFEDTPAFEWLSKNAYKFGFILRYPKEKEAVTGYTYEPWHYRFVGREAATDIYFSGLTLEEYLLLL